MYDFGSIVLTRFPFTNLSGGKVRPALVVSRDNARRCDVVLAFITSRVAASGIPDSLPIQPSPANGLKVPSLVRFDKLVTLESRVIVGKIGDAEPAFLDAACPVFFNVFGFGVP
jgi:mRNA-degrading endonuclease toxin of MazEF toxin-antitoxin module